jgi:hypothetical protein
LTKGAVAALAQAQRTPSAELAKQASHMTAVASDMPEVDRAPEPTPEPSPQGYDFSDDAVQSAPAETLAPSVARKRKAAHQSAFESLH